MKKTILLTIMVLGVFLLAGCTKTQLNTMVVTGNWKHVKTETVLDGVPQQPWYPGVDSFEILYHFDSDGSYYRLDRSLINPALETRVSGAWLVDGSKLILSFPGGSRVYHIEKAGLLELILIESYDELGHHYTDALTLRKK